jgi:hypothetical protein
MSIEKELIAEIGLKTREQYMATWALIYHQDAVVKRAESEYESAAKQNRINKKHENAILEAKQVLETTWKIASRNKVIYDDELEFLKLKLESIQTNDVDQMKLVNCKNAKFQLTGNYNATFTEVYAAVKNYKTMIDLEIEDPRLTYYKLMHLFDLPEYEYQGVIEECYQLALSLADKQINIYNYIGAYERMYL